MPAHALVHRLAFCLALCAPTAFACSGQLHIELADVGVYALDQAEIAAAQPTLADCALDDLVLTQGGKEVPLNLVSGAGRSGKGYRIEWIGQPLHGPMSWYDAYSVNNVYQLGTRSGAHPHMEDAPAVPDRGQARLVRTLHLEQENLMIRLDEQQQKPGEEPDVWQWAKLTQVDPAPFEASFELPDLARDGEPQLTLSFRGLSTIVAPRPHADAKPPDHFVEASLNGTPLAPLAWDGRDEVKLELAVPPGALRPSGNVLQLVVPKRPLPWDEASVAIDVVMFNWAEVTYPIGGDLEASSLAFALVDSRSFELTAADDSAPVLYAEDGLRMPGLRMAPGRWRFAATAAGTVLHPVLGGAFRHPLALRAVRGEQWRQPQEGFDYLMVAHPSLIEAIQPLAEFHRGRGLSVAVLDVNDVYDQFNHGIPHPRAIQQLVRTAWHEWPRRPRFLLLVGGASFDIRHATYDDLKYAKWTDRELLFPGHFGSVAGTPFKEQPAHLGDRNLIPTYQYPSPEGQSASDNPFAVIDDSDWHPSLAVGRLPVARPEEVTAIVDKTIRYLSTPRPGAWRRDVMFITDEIASFKQASDQIANGLGAAGFVADKVYASPEVSDNAAHQRAIRDGIDEGRLLVHFIGHGGRYIWRTGPPDLHQNNDLFTIDDVSSLANSGTLPMVLSMTCYSAPFDNPAEDSIGEKFLREPGKGAIAVFAASWRNSPSPAFSKELIDALLTPGTTIGDAIVRTKRNSQDRVLVEMYNLLGDPAVVLDRPHGTLRAMADAKRWSPGVLVDLGGNQFSGSIRVDWLDAKGNSVAATDYRAQDARFRLAVPTPADGRAIAAVRVYAASDAGDSDAVGGAELAPVAATPTQGRLASWGTSLAEWWREWRRPPYQEPPRHPDTLFRGHFDNPTPQAE